MIKSGSDSLAAEVAIEFICVGGTIDKVYFDASSKYEVGSPAVKALLKELPIAPRATITSLMAKDSLDMTDADRQLIADAVAASAFSKVVVTHGTDTMTQTAEAIQARLTEQDSNKVVVLTGALAPAIFKRSDAEFNLGTAIAATQCAQPGVYIAMNGQVFTAGRVRKDLNLNRFVVVD